MESTLALCTSTQLQEDDLMISIAAIFLSSNLLSTVLPPGLGLQEDNVLTLRR